MRGSYANVRNYFNLYFTQQRLSTFYVNKLIFIGNPKHSLCTDVRTATSSNESVKIVEELQKLLTCEFGVAKKICDAFPSIRSPNKVPEVRNNVKLLLAYGVTERSIVENPFSLVLPSEMLMQRLDVLTRMKPKDLNDILPLIKLDSQKLFKFKEPAARIYHFSEQLKFEIKLMSEAFARNEFLFERNYSNLQKKLKILLDYKVPASDIIQNLSVFGHSESRLISRLEQMKSAGIHGNRVWLIKLAHEMFERAIRNKVENHQKRFLNCHDDRKDTAITDDSRIEKVEEVPTNKKNNVLNFLCDHLLCDETEATVIYYNQQKLQYFDQLAKTEKNIELLTRNGVSYQTMINNPYLITMDIVEIELKLMILSDMKPREMDDFVPLQVLSMDQLKRVQIKWEAERHKIPESNRVYSFSDALKIEPPIVTKHIAKHSHILFGEFNKIKAKLDLLISYKIPSLKILEASYVFRSSEEKMKNNYKFLKQNGLNEIMPGMFDLDVNRMNKLVEQHHAERKALSGCTDINGYLRKRLEWDEDTLKSVQRKYPYLFKSTAIRIKNHLDYLLIEKNFTASDINRCLRVFQIGLVEIKNRFNELEPIIDASSIRAKLGLRKNAYLEMIEVKIARTNDPRVLQKLRLIHNRLKRGQ